MHLHSILKNIRGHGLNRISVLFLMFLVLNVSGLQKIWLVTEIALLFQKKKSYQRLPILKLLYYSLDFLIASHADINLVDRFGRLPLHYAAAKAWFDCIFILVSAG